MEDSFRTAQTTLPRGIISFSIVVQDLYLRNTISAAFEDALHICVFPVHPVDCTSSYRCPVFAAGGFSVGHENNGDADLSLRLHLREELSSRPCKRNERCQTWQKTRNVSI